MSLLKSKKYESYNSEDFVADEYFLSWVNTPSDSSVTCFWLAFLNKYPEKSNEIMLARKQILKLKAATLQLSEAEISDLWHRINLTIATN